VSVFLTHVLVCLTDRWFNGCSSCLLQW